MNRTLSDKIWNAHRVAKTPGGADLIAIDRVFLHERTGAAALNAMAAAGRAVADPARVFAVTDHIIDTRPNPVTGRRTDATMVPGGQAFITETRAACQTAGITLFDVDSRDQGIVHVISPELSVVLPGLTLVAPDSHTCTQGAFGALAWGIGSSEAELAMATGTLRLTRPRTMRVTFAGQLAPGVTAMDMALALIAAHSAGGGVGHVVEFAGDAVAALDMEARMTLCNMATEFSAMTAIIAPDAKAFEWLAGRRYAPAQFDDPYWATLVSDPEAVFDQEIALDASQIAPMVSWGTSPEQAIPIDGRIPQGPPLLRDYIETDTIIPSREIRSTGRIGLADGLFAPWRYADADKRINDPAFALNQRDAIGTRLLLGSKNFGCGSSREHAVWALAEFGIEAIIAPSFAPIFRGNCIRNGLLPIELPEAAVRELQWAMVNINLAEQTILADGKTWRFTIDAEANAVLLEGIYAIDLTLKQSEAIAAWTAADRKTRPWVYLERTT